MFKILGADVFLKNYAIYFTGSMLVAFLNYLYYPVIGRLLDPSDFGELQVFISLLAQVSVVFALFSIPVVSVTVNHADETERNIIIQKIKKITFSITAFVFILLSLSIFQI